MGLHSWRVTGRCPFCGSAIGAGLRADARFCSKRCRQAAFRLRERVELVGVRAAETARPMHFAYADPPYPGKARRYYLLEPSYRGEVDHAALIARLCRRYPDGWALSTGAYALRALLPLCPPEVRVCPWVKPSGVSRKTRGLHNAWEALLVVGGRREPPGQRDWLRAKSAQGGGALPGRKPLAFCAWLFACLGMRAGDTLDDLYPGTGIVGRAWALTCAEAVAGDVGATAVARTRFATRAVIPVRIAADVAGGRRATRRREIARDASSAHPVLPELPAREPSPRTSPDASLGAGARRDRGGITPTSRAQPSPVDVADRSSRRGCSAR